MTTQTQTMDLKVPAVIKPRVASSLWQDAYHRLSQNKTAMVCLVIIALYIAMAILALLGLLASDYATVNSDNAFALPSSEYLFGTDFFGRSVLSRAIHGTITALTVGFFSAVIALVIGVSLGAIAGYFGGWVDDSITWLYTTLDSIPYILLLASFQFAMGPGLINVFVALGLTSWVSLARLIRGEVMKQKEKEYVEAARSIGASNARRIFNHILPNVMHLGLIQFGLIFVSAIKTEVILSFLGLGVAVGTPSWGAMINDARQELQGGNWQNLVAATIFMFGLVISVNLFNDALRDALDPKLKNK